MAIMDVHRIGVFLSLEATGFHHGMALVFARLSGLEKHVDMAQNKITGLRTSLLGLGAIGAGLSLAKAFEPLIEAGAKLDHFRVQLKAAGYTSQEVSKAMSAAWKEAGNNMNTSVSDNLRDIHHIANIVGGKDAINEAISLLPIFNKARAAIQSLKDEHLRAHFSGDESYTYDFARALEELGVTSTRPGETSADAEKRVEHYAGTALRAIIAMRGKVDPHMLYQAVQNAGGTQLKWSEDFLGHELFSLLQTFGPRTGNMGYMINAGLAQGRVTSQEASGLLKYGILPQDAIAHDPHSKGGMKGRFTGFKAGSVINSQLLGENWVRWFREVFVPELARHEPGTGRLLTDEEIAAGKGIHTDEQLNAVLDEIFRQKTRRQAAGYATMTGTRTAMLKERVNIDRVDRDAVGIMQEEDPSLIWKQWHYQVGNLMAAVGDPLMAQGLPFLKELTVIVKELSQAAAAHPEAVKIIGYGLAGLAAGLVAVGTVLLAGVLLGAIGVGGTLIVGLTALAAAAAAAAGGVDKLVEKIRGFFNSIGSALSGMFPNALRKPDGSPAYEDDGMGGKVLPQRYIGPPPSRGGGMQKVVLNVDGRTLGEIVAHHIARGMEHVSGPAHHDGSLSLTPIDLDI